MVCDEMTLRIALIDETGEFTVNGQRCKVVPVEPSVKSCDAMLVAIGRGFDWASHTTRANAVYDAYIKAHESAAIDLSGLPRAAGDWSALFDGMKVPK